MTIPTHSFFQYFQYVVRGDIDKFFIAIAIRNFAFGMVAVFEAVYLYLFFDSIAVVLAFYAVLYALYAVFAPLGGKLLALFGTSTSLLISFFLYLSFYMMLPLFEVSFWFIPLSLLVMMLGMAFFQPAFHLNFTRFAPAQARGRNVGKGNVAMYLPVLLSPIVGGWITAAYGYPSLFAAAAVAFVAAAIPLFSSHTKKETYQDNYRQAWKRVFSRKNAWRTAAYATNGVEFMIAFSFWPLFMFLSGLEPSLMGTVTSVSLVAAGLFVLYMGRLADTQDRNWLLNIGAIWTSLSWILKFFAKTPFDILLTHIIYRTSRTAAEAPFMTEFYEHAAEKEEEADEFIAYREIVMNASRAVFFGAAALAFLAFPGLPLQSLFLAAALLSLGIMLLNKPALLFRFKPL